MQKIITLTTDRKQGLYDITSDVTALIKSSKIQTGIASVYARGSTAAIMIQENWDQSVQHDVISLLGKLVPSGIWEHDHQDNNGDAHLKSGLIGASQTIPVIDGNPGLSTWQTGSQPGTVSGRGVIFGINYVNCLQIPFNDEK